MASSWQNVQVDGSNMPLYSSVPESGGPVPGIVVRPLQPGLPCTLALIERDDMPAEPALGIVRNALLALRTETGGESVRRRPVSAAGA